MKDIMVALLPKVSVRPVQQMDVPQYVVVIVVVLVLLVEKSFLLLDMTIMMYALMKFQRILHR